MFLRPARDSEAIDLAKPHGRTDGKAMLRSGRGRPFVAAGCLGALVLFMGGSVVGLGLAPEPSPASLTAGPKVYSVPVTYMTFDDARQTSFTLVTGASDDVSLTRAGTVTSLACKVGGTVASGDVPLSIDSIPVVALHTSYPLWRDLLPGDEGLDVGAVQSELSRLGYRSGKSAVMDRATIKALIAFFTDRGYARPDGSLLRTAFLWLPSSEVVVGSCPLKIADVVQAGDTFVKSGGGLVALHPALPTEGIALGARVVSLGQSSGPVGADGVVTDPAFLAVVAASPEYAFAASQSEKGTAPQLALTSALATPLNTAGVPAGALYRVSETSGCISSGGVGRPVTIVSSMLGSTYVTIDDGSTPTTVDLQSPADRTGKAGTCS